MRLFLLLAVLVGCSTVTDEREGEVGPPGPRGSRGPEGIAESHVEMAWSEIDAGYYDEVAVECSSGVVLGGGCTFTETGVTSMPLSDEDGPVGWLCGADNFGQGLEGDEPAYIAAYALCSGPGLDRGRD